MPITSHAASDAAVHAHAAPLLVTVMAAVAPTAGAVLAPVTVNWQFGASENATTWVSTVTNAVRTSPVGFAAAT